MRMIPLWCADFLHDTSKFVQTEPHLPKPKGEKKAHHSLICMYRKLNRTGRCVSGTLPEPGLLRFGMTASQLIGIEERREAVKMPKDRRLSFRDPETGFERQVFPALEGRALEFVRHVIPEGSNSGALPALKQGTEKYLFMEQGKVRVRLGSQEYLLEDGDLFYFVADVPQQFENIGEGVCSYFVIKMQS